MGLGNLIVLAELVPELQERLVELLDIQALAADGFQLPADLGVG